MIHFVSELLQRLSGIVAESPVLDAVVPFLVDASNK